MGKALAWNVEREGTTTAYLSGEITESTDFAPLVSSVGEGDIVLDLEKVTRINSSGVRLWIGFMNDLAKKHRNIEMRRCSVAIVHQLNMISSFRGKAHVVSFHAPYACAECGAEQVRLLDVPTAQSALTEPLACPECSGKMELDDLPDAYLGFQR